MAIYGIDLGTTQSSIGRINALGAPEILSNIEDEKTIPSVVYFESSKNIIIGTQAKSESKINPGKVVRCIKREMGSDHIVVKNNIRYRPEEISSYILKGLIEGVQRTEKILVKDVVITCPAYFSTEGREATKKAAELAGLNVRAIINEPTAAGIAYDYTYPSKSNTILVYDLGGGTFDVSILSKKGESIDVITTMGDARLGGDNWDQVVLEYIQETCEKETGLLLDDLPNKEELSQEMLEKAEKMKRALSVKNEARESIVYGGKGVRIILTRDMFDSLTSYLLKQTLMLLDKALEKAKADGYRVDEVILVGGSSKMPQVKDAVFKKMNMEPRIFEPELAIAKGAAIYAHKLENQKVHIQDIATKSYGVICYVNDVRKISNVFLKDNKLPSTGTSNFFPRSENSKEVSIKISQNSSSNEYTELSDPTHKIIGEMVLKLPKNAGTDTKIEVTFSLDTNGILKAKAVECKNGNSCDIEINLDNRMSEEEARVAIDRVNNSRILE